MQLVLLQQIYDPVPDAGDFGIRLNRGAATDDRHGMTGGRKKFYKCAPDAARTTNDQTVLFIHTFPTVVRNSFINRC